MLSERSHVQVLCLPFNQFYQDPTFWELSKTLEVDTNVPCATLLSQTALTAVKTGLQVAATAVPEITTVSWQYIVNIRREGDFSLPTFQDVHRSLARELRTDYLAGVFDRRSDKVS